MKVAIVGCGGIGGVVACAASINSSGGFAEFYCIEANEEYAKKLEDRGISLTGKKGVMHSNIKCFGGFPENLTFDIIFLAVKNNSLRNVFTVAKDHLTDKGYIVTLQNGIEVLKLRDEFPYVKLVAGAVGYNSIMLEHGVYEVTSDGGITIGNLNQRFTPDLNPVKSLLEPYIKVVFSDNMEGVLWGKLLIVLGVTGLGGVAGLRVGELLNIRVARKLFYMVVREGYEVAKKLGVNVKKFQGVINPINFRINGGLPIFIKYMILKLIGRKFYNLKSNIYHSIERGEKTEIDYLNGAVVSYAKRLGISVPVNELIVRYVKEIEDKKRDMSINNLYEIYDTVKKKK